MKKDQKISESAFEIYMNKVRISLDEHFGNDGLPISVKHVLSDKVLILRLYIEGWHPKRTAEFILQKCRENAMAHLKKRLSKYAVEKCRLALRDDPDFTMDDLPKIL